MTTVKEVADGAKLPTPLYQEQPYIVLGIDRIVLFAGTEEQIAELSESRAGYYDACEVEVRTNDLYMNDNTRIASKPEQPQETTVEEIAQHYPQVKELLEAYEHCLEEIGNQRQGINNMNAIMTSMQNNINSLVQENETLRPLLSMGLQMRQAQTTYYGMKSKHNQQQRKGLATPEDFMMRMREWLVASKINEDAFDGHLTKAVAFRNQAEGKPAEPDQPELL